MKEGAIIPLPPASSTCTATNRSWLRSSTRCSAKRNLRWLNRPYHLPVETAMSPLLEDITSCDPMRIWSSACAIIKLRDTPELDRLATHLGEIESATRNVGLGGALFPNSVHLRFALRKLAYHRDHPGCLCRLYPEYLLYNPQQEAATGNVRIDDVTYLDGNWVDAYTCTCLVCGARYRVEERESHYTWWGWKELLPADAPA